MRDDSNGEVRFLIQDLEKFRILTEITLLPFFRKVEFSQGFIEEGHKTNKKRKYVGQQGAKGGDSKRFRSNCFVCNKQGYRAKDCRNHKA